MTSARNYRIGQIVPSSNVTAHQMMRALRLPAEAKGAGALLGCGYASSGLPVGAR
jgi:phospholipid N-methyltransferase